MKIISKFHDYYDSVLSYGMDLTHVYKRETIEILLDNAPKFILVDSKKQDKLFKNIPQNLQKEILRYANQLPFCFRKHPYDFNLIECFFIFFCGKVFYQEVYKIPDKENIDCFTFDESKKVILKYGDKYEKRLITENKPPLFGTRKDELYNHNFINLDFVEELHHYFSSPAIKLEKEKIIINPCLREIKFYKLLNPFQTYQEIDMYISGILSSPQKEIAEISDKDRISKHGFDGWSFRKKPQTKKGRCRE